MRAPLLKIPIIMVLVLLVLTACLGNNPAPATPMPSDVAFTQAAKTIVAELTRNAPTPTPTSAKPSPTPTLETLPSTSTPLPTSTPAPTFPPPPVLPPPATATPTPVTQSPEFYQLAFSDDFQKGYSGWYKQDSETLKFGFSYGGYSMENKTENAWKVSARVNQDMQFVDMRVEVTGYRMKGTLYGFYGVVCRFADLSHYYFLGVGSDGWYGIGKMKFSIPYMLVEGKNTRAVHTGNAPNHIVADCKEDLLSLTVNDVLVAVVQDLDFSAGSVGLIVGTREIPGYKVLFDDFKVYIIE
jgi:hypothetical protein